MHPQKSTDLSYLIYQRYLIQAIKPTHIYTGFVKQFVELIKFYLKI